MLKAIINYSKKIPIPGQQFSSQSYHLSLETEISDGLDDDVIRQRIHETFELVKSTVEEELQGSNKQKQLQKPSEPSKASAPTPVPKPAEKVSDPGKASNAQIKYICDLSQQKGMDLSFITDVIRKEFKVESLYMLNKSQASSLVNRLKEGRSQKAA